MPLPLAFALLPTTLSSPRLTPLLSVELNGVTIYRTLDPEPGEPFVSSSLLLLSQSLPPILALTKYDCRLPLGYDTTLSGLAPFPDIWIPLATARIIAKDLGVLEPLGWLLSWKTRAMSTWFEGVGEDGGGVVAHNWRLPEDRADPSAYSHQTLLSTPITSNIVLLPAHQTILTLLSPTQLSSLLSVPTIVASIPPTPISHLWPSLILLTTESFEAYLSSTDSSPTIIPSANVLASLVLPFLHLLGDESAFPLVERDELVKLMGGRRGLTEEGRKAWVKGVEVLGGILVGLLMGRVRWEASTSKGKGREVVLPLRDDEDDHDHQQQDTEEALLEISPPTPSQPRRNGFQPSGRRNSPSRSRSPRPVDPSTRLPSPPPPLPPTPSTSTSIPTPPSSNQIISSQLSTLIAQIDSLSLQIEAQAQHPPPPRTPPPSSMSSSLGSVPSPPSSPTATTSNSRSWVLVVLLVLSNLGWLVGVGWRGGGGGGRGEVASTRSVEVGTATTPMGGGTSLEEN